MWEIYIAKWVIIESNFCILITVISPFTFIFFIRVNSLQQEQINGLVGTLSKLLILVGGVLAHHRKYAVFDLIHSTNTVQLWLNLFIFTFSNLPAKLFSRHGYKTQSRGGCPGRGEWPASYSSAVSWFLLFYQLIKNIFGLQQCTM